MHHQQDRCAYSHGSRIVRRLGRQGLQQPRTWIQRQLSSDQWDGVEILQQHAPLLFSASTFSTISRSNNCCLEEAALSTELISRTALTIILQHFARKICYDVAGASLSEAACCNSATFVTTDKALLLSCHSDKPKALQDPGPRVKAN